MNSAKHEEKSFPSEKLNHAMHVQSTNVNHTTYAQALTSNLDRMT